MHDSANFVSFLLQVIVHVFCPLEYSTSDRNHRGSGILNDVHYFDGKTSPADWMKDTRDVMSR